MLKKTIVIFVMLFCFTITAGAVSTSAEAAILMEADTQTVLYEHSSRIKLPMASTTKIMTALVTIENATLSDVVTVSEEAAGTEGSSMYLKNGEKITVGDLLYGLMLSSGNDAANALAEHIGGTKDDFVRLMNEKANELSLMNTSFKTPSGLDEKGHYSTANDMALLTANALKNDTFKKIVSTKSISVGEGENKHFLTNHNRLLSSYKYCIGVKTGYTISSGRCLVSAAQKDGVTLIAVTLNDRNDWKDHIALFDYGFSKTKSIKFSDVNDIIGELPVVGAEGKNTITVHPEKTLQKVFFEDKKISQEVILPRFLYAPVQMGDKVGEIRYYSDGELIECVNLVAAEEIKQLKDKEINGFINLLGRIFVAILKLK